MSAGSLNSDASVQQVLARCRRQILQHNLLLGISSIAIVATALMLGAGVLDYLLVLPANVRALVLAVFCFAVGLVAWKSLIAPLRTQVPPEQLGAAVDLSSPNLHESLSTLISLQRPGVTASEAGSEYMRSILKQQVVQQLSLVQINSVVDRHKAVRRCGIAGLLMLTVLLPLLFWPSLTSLLFQRMVSPFKNLATPGHLFFEVPDGNRTVARGSTVRVSAEPKWRNAVSGQRPEQVDLKLIAGSGESDVLPMLYDEVAGCYLADLERIAADVQYQVTGGGVVSETYSLTVVDAPEVRGAVLTATPPVYSGRAIQRFDGMLGEMEVFERSQLEVFLEFNKPVTRASLVWSDRDARPVTEAEMLEIEFDDLSGEEVFDLNPDAPLKPATEPLATRVAAVLAPDRRSASLRMPADAGGDFVFEVVDEHDLTNSQEPDRHLTVIFDTPPELQVSGLRDGDRFRPDDILPLNCLAVDDIGVGVLEMYYRINNDVEKIVPATNFDAGALEVSHAFRLPLETLSLKSDDVLSVRVRAADERPDPGPQETWWKPVRIQIDINAAAAGQKALDEETQQMVEALKQLEKLLQQDTDQARELQSKARRDWDDAAREQTQRLSEKEQQQGQILEKLAAEVATHPLMQSSSEELKNLSGRLRKELADAVQQAADKDRLQAASQLGQAGQDLEKIRQALNTEIQNIEQMAQLEQQLAGLNRLALDAEQLAKDAQQLEENRRQPDNKPAEMDQAQWQQQLDDQQQNLMLEEQQLSSEINQMLEQTPELLQAAQEGQRQQLKSLAEVAKQLAQQQKAVAEAVQAEAERTARDATGLVQQLQTAKRDAASLNTETAKLEDIPAASMQALQEAATQLEQGDLAAAEERVQQSAEEVRTIQEQLKQTPDATPDSAAATAQASKLQQQLQAIGQQLDALQQARQPHQATSQSPAAASDSESQTAPEQNPVQDPVPNPAQPPNQPPARQNDVVQDVQQQLQQLAQTAQEIAAGVQSDSESNQPAREGAEQAATQSAQASQQAQSGQFSQAAQQLRNASTAAQQTAQQLQTAEQQERRSQTQRLQQDLQRMADTLQALQQDDAARLSAQQSAQQRIADQAADLPRQLQDVVERLNLEPLQMAPQAQQSQLARQAAQQAQQTSQQAAADLQQQNLNRAGRQGQSTRDQLERLAELAQQAGQPSDAAPSPVPTDVGESVADAMQNLAQAAQSMQQSSQMDTSSQQPQDSGQSAEQSAQNGNQPPGSQSPGSNDAVAANPGSESGDGQQASAEPGNGKPGSGQPSGAEPSAANGQPSSEGQGGGEPGTAAGSQQLSSAAQALAQAAKQALPSQFHPGQLSENGDSSGQGRDAMGNASLWNGLLPGASAGPAGTRNWGRLNEELDTETADSAGTTRDSEYEALIRMYFKEVAKAAAAGK